MNESLEALVAEVSETTTVQESASALITGLAARVIAIKEELAAQNVTNEALNQLSADLDSSNTALAEAVVANTPAE